MHDAHRRKLDKIDREDVMIADNAADFPNGTKVADYTALIAVEKAKFLAFDAQQTSGFDDRRQAQELYEESRDLLVDLLEEFVLAADIIDDDVPGTAAKYKMPRPRTDANLIAKSTSFFNDSPAIEDALEAAGLRKDGRDFLITFRDNFQQAANAHDSAEEKHAEGTGGMDDSMRKMMHYSRRRDKSVRMKYRQNPAKLAAWTVASHLDRAPKPKPPTP